MELRLALRLAPENPEYHYNLANALLKQAGQGLRSGGRVP